MADPQVDEGSIPITDLDELETHLQELLQSPDTVLDEDIIDNVGLQLTGTNTPPLTTRFLPVLIQILAIYKSDPAIINDFALKLLKPVTFAQALELASEDGLVEALQSHSPSTNILAIAVIEKAAQSPGDAAVLSVMRIVVAAFLRTWLTSPHVEVGERAGKALADILSMDCDHSAPRALSSNMHGLQINERRGAGQALFWRRIFQDREIYRSLFDLCSYRTVGNGGGKLNERQKSLAQARLLRVLPRMAVLDFSSIAHTKFPDIEQEYGMKKGEEGLLWFAATNMVNKERDMLMHITLIDFFPELFGMMTLTEMPSEEFGPYLRKFVRKVSDTDIIVAQTFRSIALNVENPIRLRGLLIILLDLQDQMTD